MNYCDDPAGSTPATALCISYSQNTLLCQCTAPVSGQTYTSRACSSCSAGGCQTDTTVAACTTRCPVGTYVSAACRPGTTTALGADTVCSACPPAPANAVYLAGLGCTPAWAGAAGGDYAAFPGCAAAFNTRACYALADLYFATQQNAAAWATALTAPGATPDNGWAFSPSNYCAWLGVGCADAAAVRCVSDTAPGCVLRSLCVRCAAPLLLSAAHASGASG
jgi:hypothetical protein